jgi:hypothetical protein
MNLLSLIADKDYALAISSFLPATIAPRADYFRVFVALLHRGSPLVAAPARIRKTSSVVYLTFCFSKCRSA